MESPKNTTNMGDISKDIQSTFPSNKTKALINIKYTANWVDSQQNAFFMPYGISPQQYNILRILKGAKKPMKVQAIKDRMVERAPNATRMMDKLSAKDLIQRVHCASDRRVVHVEIRGGGVDLLAEIAANFKNDPLENLSEEEAIQLSDLLDKIR